MYCKPRLLTTKKRKKNKQKKSCLEWDPSCGGSDTVRPFLGLGGLVDALENLLGKLKVAAQHNQDDRPDDAHDHSHNLEDRSPASLEEETKHIKAIEDRGDSWRIQSPSRQATEKKKMIRSLKNKIMRRKASKETNKLGQKSEHPRSFVASVPLRRLFGLIEGPSPPWAP
jgi:exonuclease VII large subunit